MSHVTPRMIYDAGNDTSSQDNHFIATNPMSAKIERCQDAKLTLIHKWEKFPLSMAAILNSVIKDCNIQTRKKHSHLQSTMTSAVYCDNCSLL